MTYSVIYSWENNKCENEIIKLPLVKPKNPHKQNWITAGVCHLSAQVMGKSQHKQLMGTKTGTFLPLFQFIGYFAGS